MRKYIFILIIFIFYTQTVKAQNNFSLLTDNVYAINYNPAHKLDNKFYIGIPILSNTHFLLSYNFGPYNKLAPWVDTARVITSESIVKHFDKKRNIYNELNTELLGFGVKIKEKFYFNLSSRLRSETLVELPNELLCLLAKGNAYYMGKEISSQIAVQSNSFLEINAGLQYNINDMITVGVRPKMMFGIANVKTNYSNISFFTDEDWSIKINGNMDLNLTMPMTLNRDNADSILVLQPDLLFKGFFNNTGFAIDVGAEFRLPYNFNASVALLDFGSIKWKYLDKTFQYKLSTITEGDYVENGDIVIDGFTLPLDEIFSGELDTIGQVIDTLESIGLLSSELIEAQAYTSSVHPKLLINIGYNYKNYYFSASTYNIFVKNKIIPSFTIGCTASYFDKLQLALSYSIRNKTYGNIGFGVHYSVGIFNIYASCDNLVGAFCPLYAQNTSIQFGIYLSK